MQIRWPDIQFADQFLSMANIISCGYVVFKPVKTDLCFKFHIKRKWFDFEQNQENKNTDLILLNHLFKKSAIFLHTVISNFVNIKHWNLTI